MSDIEATKRVRDTLDFVLKPILDGFVEANMKKKHGVRWLHFASRSAGSGPADPLDVYGLLKTILDNWQDVFGGCFDRKVTHKARTFTSLCLDARNATAHLSLPLSDAEALRYLDAMQELASLLKAPDVLMSKLRTAYVAQRGGTAAPAPGAAEAPARLALEEAAPTGALRPWVEVALPHPDVMANRFKEAEFAADLFAVDSGNASEGYATPMAFFGITFLTEGLQRVLVAALQRMGGVGGDPVIGLQTAFGGGKTHTMLAIYHLAKHLYDGGDPRELPGMEAIVARAGLSVMPRPQVTVFVGSARGTDVSLTLREGPKVYTLWGYMAWRIAGEAGLRLVEEAERARTNPGSALLVELFRLSGPAVILLDEVVAYARQLPDDRFEALLSFVQSLTEAAKMVPGILVVGSLPESDIEAGGDKGVQALRRLQAVFGRVHSNWLPAQGDETYEIIRRRLFQQLDTEGEKARDQTVKAFHELYRKNPAEFPPEARETRYLELLRVSYPIHPELFDRLSKEWASLEKFQRTRGVLRFMANVIGVLWHERSGDPLILPARVPVSHERVRASVLYPLNPAFAAVVDREVDGEGSLPIRMEANPSRRISQARAATRAARAVFICSAPLSGQPNAGITGPSLRLACAEPGDQLAVFGEALRELSERATYLYEESGRYWFSTQPTLNRLAEERAKAFPEHQVDEAIAEILRKDGTQKGGFTRVHAAPDDPTSVEESAAPALVILGPHVSHSGRGTSGSTAVDAAVDALMRCRNGQRRFRNTLVFAAADAAQLETAKEVVRKALAWESIQGDDRLQEQLTQAQAKDAVDKARSHRDASVKAVRSAWSHILYPEKSETQGRPFDLHQTLITARDRGAIPATVYDKARSDGVILERLGAERLWLALKDIWSEDRPHLAIHEIAEWFASYVYLPKLRDRVVLEASVRDAVSQLAPKFGFATGFDEATGKYLGLTFAKAPPEFLPEGSLLVSDRAARTQQAASSPIPSAPEPEQRLGTQPPATTDRPAVATPGPVSQSSKSKPTRFFGTVELDTSRPIRSLEAIMSAVVAELQRTAGTRIKLTVEIEAVAETGFDEADIGVVRDNARQLKFRPESTGFGD